MPTNFELEKAYNENQLDEIQFTLQDRKEPTLVMISVPTYDLQVKVLAKLKERVPQYQFYDIDLTPFQVISLHQTLQEKLPKSIIESERITYCVNVFGLENSRLSSEDRQIVDSGMIAQLNFEREIIFRKPNYITILWGDHDFFIQLQRKAPDLWSWVTNFFVFKEDEIHQEKELSPQPHEVPAKLPIREEYIKSLKDKLEHLPLNDTDKGRAMRERLNLYSLLADEYAKYFDFENAKKYYENAIGVAEKLKVTGYHFNKLLFDYATLNLDYRKLDKALRLYQEVLNNDILNDNLYNLGSAYHQIGRVYEEQRNWGSALENYQKAIDLKEKMGQEDRLGSTYHQIGMLYERQRNWKKALENYQRAIDWKEKTGQRYQLGNTYHQIGIVYQVQSNCEKALENYQKAIEWDEKTGQEYQFGGTYHQIGLAYEEQKNWNKALENYEMAIYWKEKTGQEYQLSSTYLQIGKVYEKQGNDILALENFEKALSFTPEYFEVEKVNIEKSIERVKDKLSEKS